MNSNINMKMQYSIALIIFSVLLLIPQVIHAEEPPLPFYPGGTYNSGIPAPDEILGFSIGERPVRYWETVQYLQVLAEKSPRVRLVQSGETYEKRKLYYLLVSSEDNMARLDSIRDSIDKLADPRKIESDSETKRLVDSTPAVVWMMYTIHGDELSGTDASLQLAYQLAAGTDPETVKLLRELVVGIYPMQNPDGRERFMAQMQQWSGEVPNNDGQSIQHSSVWPWGRTNHYLFDLNRDWFILAHPESRARVKALLAWKPQVVADAHEMGQYSTYLFNPPREPINLHVNRSIRKWWKVFTADQAKAFDRYGWSYYTREWLDDWFPGYTTSWSDCIGAVGILYEQAFTAGSLVKRPDGTVLTFHDAVHHQFVSSIANLSTAADNRKALLRDYYDMKKVSVSPPEKGSIRTYLINPDRNPSRALRLIERLLMQGIEVEAADEEFELRKAQSCWDSRPAAKTFPAGTYIIRVSQPMRPLLDAILELDPRMTTETLQAERDDLEKGKGTRMYEVSTWSMLMAYDVDAYVSEENPQVKTKKLGRVSGITGRVVNPDPGYGFVIDYGDDCAVEALVKLLESGYKVRITKKPFKVEGKSFSRGSILLRIVENPAGLKDDIRGIALSTHTVIYGVDTALSEEGPDLGGEEFQLLEEPRIALLTGPDVNMYNFSTLWYLLDWELKCRYSILDYHYFDSLDLRKYNVLVLPSTRGGPSTYNKIFSKNGMTKLKEWITGGGTLIGIANGAVFLADSTTALSRVKLRRQTLKDIEIYKRAVKLEDRAGKTKVDSLAIWEGKGLTEEDRKEKKDEKETDKKKPEKLSDEEVAEIDRHQRLFMPRGVIFRTKLNEEHWLNFGVGKEVPATVYTSYALLSKKPVQTAARFSGAAELRLSGLLWPEARIRWEKSAYATRESYGKGQIILFAGEPNYRSYFYGTGKMLINSLLLGPGFGTRPVVEW